MKDYSTVKSKYRNLKHWMECEMGWCLFGICLFSLGEQYYAVYLDWNQNDLLLTTT